MSVCPLWPNKFISKHDISMDKESMCISLGRITPQNSFSKFNGKR